MQDELWHVALIPPPWVSFTACTHTQQSFRVWIYVWNPHPHVNAQMVLADMIRATCLNKTFVYSLAHSLLMLSADLCRCGAIRRKKCCGGIWATRQRQTVFDAARAHFRRDAAAFKIWILLRFVVALETLRVSCSVNTLTEFLWRFFFHVGTEIVPQFRVIYKQMN